MSLASVGQGELSGAAGTASLGGALPEWLTALVDPVVWSARDAAIADRFESVSSDAGLRHECARVMADYFIERFTK